LGTFLITQNLVPETNLSFLASATSGTAMRVVLILFSLAAVYSSAMVYRDTPRLYWASKLTSVKFFLTGIITGMAGLLALVVCFNSSGIDKASTLKPHFAVIASIAIGLAFIVKLACEARIQKHVDDQEANPLKKTALLLRGELRFIHGWRFNLGILGGLVLPMFWMYRGYTGTGPFDPAMSLCILMALLAGECLERFLFFTACVPPRMPGA
jgi:DMSO reductase anchor subunit